MLPTNKIRKLKLFLNSHIFPAMLSTILLMLLFNLQASAANKTPALLAADQIRKIVEPSPTIADQQVIPFATSEITPTPATQEATPVPAEEKENMVSSFLALLDKKKQEAEQVTVEAKEPECKISNIFTPEVQRWGNDICRWSKQYNMDPDLIATVMQIESCGNPNAVSFTGVPGLFQVAGENLDGENGFDPEVSAAKGPGKVLRYELDSAGGNVTAALAGYNGGAIAREYIAGRMSRSQLYWNLRNSRSGFWRTASSAWAKINEIEWYAHWAGIYFDAKGGRTDTLNEWLNMGGARLCPSTQS